MLPTVRISRQQYSFSCVVLPIEQKGAVLIMLLTILVLGTLTTLVISLAGGSNVAEQDMKTAKALAHAKEALIAHAVPVRLWIVVGLLLQVVVMLLALRASRSD